MFDDFLDPFGLGPITRRPPAAEPPPTPQEADSRLGGLLEESLGGLGYLGKVLDKTFGGRAVRGVLGGRPEELLSAVPLSDTLGLTDERNAVHGRDLLAQSGLLTPGDTGWQNELAGTAAEIGLDPATFLGAGAIKAAAKFGLKAADLPLQLAGKGTELLTGGWNARKAAEDLIAPKFDWARRQADALFSTPVRGTVTPEGQAIARDVYTPKFNEINQRGMDEYANLRVKTDPLFAGKTPDQQRLIREGLLQHGETLTPDALASFSRAGLDPGQVQLAQGLVDRAVGAARDLIQPERARAVPTHELNDLAVGYVPRQLADAARRQGEGLFEFARRQAGFGGAGPAQKARLDFLTDVPGGTVGLNRLAKNPAFAGADREAVGGLSDLAVQGELQKLLQSLPNIPPGVDSWREAGELSSFLKGRPALEDYYSLNLPENIRRRFQQSARTQATSDALMAAVERHAAPAAALRAADRPAVSLAELLDRSGLSLKDANGVSEAAKLATDRLYRGGHVPYAVAFDEAMNQLKNFALPADVARDMLRIGEAWRSPQALSPVIQAWDMASNLFKTGVTTIFPAFHGRNLISGLFNAWRDHALDPAAMGESWRVLRGGRLSPEVAARLYPGMAVEDATRQLVTDAVAGRVAFGRETRQVGAANLTGAAAGGGADGLRLPDIGPDVRPIGRDLRGFAKGFVPQQGLTRKGITQEILNPSNIPGVAEQAMPNRLVAQGHALGAQVEDFTRLSHYLGARLSGAGAEEAAQRVMKYHIDYSDLTGAEREVFKRIFPWYTFSRKTLPVVLEDLATRPGRVAGATRLITGTREPYQFVPGYVGEGASVPIPGAPEGEQRYLSSFGLPMEDELTKSLGSLLHGDVTRFGEQLLGMAQPAVKAPYEFLANRQLFSGRNLTDLKPFEFATLGGLLPDPLARQLTQVVANTPASRLASTVNRFGDERKGWLEQGLNLLTGARVSDVDQQKQRSIAARDLLIDLLRPEAGVKVREEVSLPKNRQGQADPRTVELYRLYQGLESELSRRR